MAQSREQSRSPRGRHEEREQLRQISKALAALGRYPEKRPQGLRIENGAMLLSDLVEKWGSQRGLSESQILKAVRRHMVNEDTRKLRFSVQEGRDGGIVIRVMPKQGERDMWRNAEAKAPPSSVVAAGAHGQSKARLDLSLSELIQIDHRQERQQQQLAKSFYIGDSEEENWVRPRHSRRHRLAAGGGGGRRRPKAPLAILTARGSVSQALVEGTASKSGLDRELVKKITRWLSWVLKVGHAKVGVNLVGEGIATLNDLAMAMSASRPHFGQFTGQELGRVIEAEDFAGRFNVTPKGDLQKVPRNARVRRRSPRFGVGSGPSGGAVLAQLAGPPSDDKSAARASPMTARPAALADASPSPPAPARAKHAAAGRSSSASSASSGSSSRRIGRGRAATAAAAAAAAVADGRHRSRSRSASGGGEETDDSDLAERCGRSLNVLAPGGAGAASAGSTALASTAGAAAEASPPRPPGQHWTQYADDGLAWWYYEGPLGKWWFAYGQSAPQLYEEEA